jgi:hypothetical protein
MGKKKRKAKFRPSENNPLEFLKARRLASRMRQAQEELERSYRICRDGYIRISWLELKERYESLSQEERVDIDVQLAADLWGCDPRDILIKYPERNPLVDPRGKEDE